MPGTIQHHTLVYTVVIAALLAAFFDLTRIAALGAIFYLVMDIAIHWGVFRHLRDDIQASPAILISAIAFDVIVLAAFLIMKANSDPMIVAVAVGGIVSIFGFERLFLRAKRRSKARAT